MRNLTLPLIGLALAPLLAFGPAARAGDSITLQGPRLQLTATTSDDTTIQTDASLHDSVRISADNTSCLSTQGGGGIVTVDTSGCGDELGRTVIDVPPGFPLIVRQQGEGDITIGNTGGELIATVTNNGDLHAGRIGSLVLTVTGSGDVSVQAVEGATTITSSSNGDVKLAELNGILQDHQSGSGDLAVGRITASAASVQLDGSGDALLGDGRIDALSARVNGGGDLAVSATVGTADLQASGGGDIHVTNVTGPVRRQASGGSTISIHGFNLASIGLSKLAQIASTDDDSDSGPHVVTFHTRHHDVLGHILAGLVVLIGLFWVWRMVQRRGGVGTVTTQMRARAANRGMPMHPGVLAVRDTIARLESRLAAIEGYVTTREFDLHQKFRDLDRK